MSTRSGDAAPGTPPPEPEPIEPEAEPTEPEATEPDAAPTDEAGAEVPADDVPPGAPTDAAVTAAAPQDEVPPADDAPAADGAAVQPPEVGDVPEEPEPAADAAAPVDAADADDADPAADDAGPDDAETAPEADAEIEPEADAETGPEPEPQAAADGPAPADPPATPPPSPRTDDLEVAAIAEPETSPEAQDRPEPEPEPEPEPADGSEPPAAAAPPAPTATPAPAPPTLDQPGPPAADTGPDDAPTEDEPAAPAAVTGRDRLRAALRPRATRSQVLTGSLCLLLGLALATQVREHSEADLTSLRQSELIGLLDDTTERADLLQAEVRELSRTRDELLSSSDQTAAARELARERIAVLGVLAGTAPATGPGIELTISGPEVTADVLLAAVQELRDAGAEAIQVGDVRVVASTYFLDVDAARAAEATEGAGPVVEVDGTLVEAPFVFSAIGDSSTLASAMEFPGGVEETVAALDGTAYVRELERVDVTALRPTSAPSYAQSADPPTDEPAASDQ